MARAQEHPAHGSLYRTFACPLPRLLEGEWPLNESVLPLRDSRTSETASGGVSGSLRAGKRAPATTGRPGVRQIAARFGVNPETVQGISRPFVALSVSPSSPSHCTNRSIGRGGPVDPSETIRVAGFDRDCLLLRLCGCTTRQPHREHRAFARLARHSYIAAH